MMGVRNIKFMLSILLVIILLTSCADSVQVKECLNGNPFGFWYGLWHGIIAPFSFIGSLFNDDIAIYAVNNNGGWYDFGFILGIGVLSYGESEAKK